MINPTEILMILQMNGLDKNSSLQDLKTFLGKINYSEEDKIKIIEILKSQGWVLAESVPPVEVTAPAATVPPVSVPQVQIPATQTLPTLSPYQNNNVVNMSVSPKTGGVKTLVISIIVIVVVLLLCGTVSYAYVNKIGPFALSSYTEDNISSGILTKIAGIDSASYTFSGALNVVSRESDATPFTMKVSNENDLKQQYYYDGERMKSVQDILARLNSDAGYYSYMHDPTSLAAKSAITKAYPGVIDNIFTSKTSAYSRIPSLIDPETNNIYLYQATEGGKNFNLTINFSTDDAIKAIKRYNYSATSTIIVGRKVTFTKNSSPFLYFSSEPPKPFLSQMSDSLSMVPPEMNAKIALSASSEFKPQQMANWSFNLDAQGDFGDMTYKINADALRKDDNYYFKINNIPSFFLFNQLAVLKGKWVVVPAKTATSSATSSDPYNDSYSPFSSIQKGIPDTEAKYKENRDKFVKFIKKTVAIADQEKIFIFKNKPSTDTVDGRKLVKYEIGFRKDKILSFYTSVQDMIKNDPELSDYANYFDQGYLDYLKSDEFSQVFDYADKNSKFTIWTDAQGYPAIIQNVSRVVPPDSAIQLKDKQINLTIRLDVSNINKSVNIVAPNGAVPLSSFMDKTVSVGDPLDNNGVGDTTVNAAAGKSTSKSGYDTSSNDVKKTNLAKNIFVEPVTAADHVQGDPKTAKVTIIEYSDLECSFCKTYHSTLTKIFDENKANGKLAWVFRHDPLVELHSKSAKEAEATECAAEIGQNVTFWKYVSELFKNTPSDNNLDNAKLYEFADTVGLGSYAFKDCLDSGKYANKIAKQIVAANKAGAEGTPYTVLVVGGKNIPLVDKYGAGLGSISYSDLKKLIDSLL